MSTISLSFIFTTLAGLSTMIGVIPIFIKFKNENKIIASSLSFASGVMICVSITDLIPEGMEIIKKYYSSSLTIILVFSFLMLGIISSTLIEKVLPDKLNNQSLYKVGILSMLTIILHNLPEGIATFITTTKNTSLGFSLAIAIALHNIPEGISISVPIYYSTKSKFRAIFYTFISALSEPLGAILTYLFLLPIINELVLGLLFSFIAGIMLNISFTKLLPTSRKYNEVLLTKIFFIIGIIFMLVNFFL